MHGHVNAPCGQAKEQPGAPEEALCVRQTYSRLNVC